MTPPPTDPDEIDPRTVKIALRRELNAIGYDDRAIARLVRERVLVRVRRGAYADYPAWRHLDAAGRFIVRNRAAVLQAKTAVVLSHLAGAAMHLAPTWGFDLTEADLTRIDGKTGRREAGVRQHCGDIVDGDVVDVLGHAVRSPTRCALEVTAQGSVESALVVVCDLLHRERTTFEALWSRYASMERWPFTLNTEIVLRLARKEISSVGEARTWYLMYRFSLPMPEPQCEVRDAAGTLVATVDFAWPELGVFLEFDGKVKYLKHLRPGESAADAVMREKKREERIRRITGWRCIRLDWADLAHPEATAAMILRMLEPVAV